MAMKAAGLAEGCRTLFSSLARAKHGGQRGYVVASSVFRPSCGSRHACRRAFDSEPVRWASVSALAAATLLPSSQCMSSALMALVSRCCLHFGPASGCRAASTTAVVMTAKRPVRKKPLPQNMPSASTPEARPRLASSKPDVYSVVAYATAEEYNLQLLAADLAKQGLYRLNQLPTDVPDVLYATSAYAQSAEPRELFVFREGTVVFWNVEQPEVEAFLQVVRQHELDSYDRHLVTTEQEEMDFTYHEGATRLVQDELRLRKALPSADKVAVSEEPGRVIPAASEPEVDEEDSLALQKYSVSNAMSLSVKLSIWEASLSRYVDSIEFVTEDLKSGNKLRMSRRDVLRKTGELYALRHLINLSSDLLDTPDFYWDRERLERLYLQTCAYLNITRRTKVMNEKLNYCCELTGLLREHLNHNHSARLEWMIIVLIMVEIIFEVMHYMDKKKNEEVPVA